VDSYRGNAGRGGDLSPGSAAYPGGGGSPLQPTQAQRHKTIQAFSTRLRDQIDLDTLSTELLAVVDQTMEPTRASLWLRPPPHGSSGTVRSEPRPTKWAY